jgi:hypothetical protein
MSFIGLDDSRRISTNTIWRSHTRGTNGSRLMDEHKWIAGQNFRCVTRDGKVLATHFRLGEPVRMEEEGELQAYSRCRIALQPLADDRWIAGENSFQAICLSLDYLRTVLKVFIADGGCVYWGDTDSHVDTNSAWFAPMPSFAQLRRNLDGT